MALEIERKWLVDSTKVSTLPFNLEVAERHRIEQSYLSFYPQVRLRSIDDGVRYLITVKASVQVSAEGAAQTPAQGVAQVSAESAAQVPEQERAQDVSRPYETLARREYEAEITPESYRALRPETQGKTLLKTRYVIPAGEGRTWEIDIYEGEFAGLVVAEMEFESEEAAAAFPTPAWALRDISIDPAFKNVVMAQEGGNVQKRFK